MSRRSPIDTQCKACGKVFHAPPSAKQKFCSRACHYSLGRKLETICGNCGKPFHSRQSRKQKFCSIVCMGLSKSGVNNYFYGKTMSSENSPRWIKDRTKLAKRQVRNDYAYKEWRKNVWVRDGFKCRIDNTDCQGRIEAHHILSWRDYPELRYQPNNGITLCQAHHPRKRNEEA